VSTLLVVLPQIILCQTLLQPSYSSYADSGALFTPSASYRNHRKASKHHGVKKASSNWDQKANPSNYYYQPEAQQSSYDDHRGAQQQEYSPQASSYEQVKYKTASNLTLQENCNQAIINYQKKKNSMRVDSCRMSKCYTVLFFLLIPLWSSFSPCKCYAYATERHQSRAGCIRSPNSTLAPLFVVIVPF
jgi:hypothetical protein